jgi:hypothetical protein
MRRHTATRLQCAKMPNATYATLPKRYASTALHVSRHTAATLQGRLTTTTADIERLDFTILLMKRFDAIFIVRALAFHMPTLSSAVYSI